MFCALTQVYIYIKHLRQIPLATIYGGINRLWFMARRISIIFEVRMPTAVHVFPHFPRPFEMVVLHQIEYSYI
jgi:hypothetical protein